MSPKKPFIRQHLLVTAMALCPLVALHCPVASALTTQERQEVFSFNIPAQPLAEALLAFAQQTQLQVSVNSELVADKQSPTIQGELSIDAALAQLLRDTNLRPVINDRMLSLEEPPTVSSMPPIKVSGSYTVRSTNNATGLDMSIRETPQSVAVITRQQIADLAHANVAEVLEQTTGVSLNRAETDRVFPTSRGIEISNIQIDGALVGGAAYSVESDFLSDTAIYERVEIIRGAGGLLVGSGDPSAAINLVRKKPTEETTAMLQLKGGRWDLIRTEADVSGSLSDNGSVRGRLVAAYQKNSSYIDFLDQDKSVLYGILEADVSASTLVSIGIDYQDYHTDGVGFGEGVPLYYSDGGRTDLPRSTTTGTDWTFRNRDRTISFVTVEHDFDNEWYLRLSGSYLSGNFDDERLYVTGTFDRLTGEGMQADADKSNGKRLQKSLDIRLSGPYVLGNRTHDLTLGWSQSYGRDSREKYASLSTPATGNFYEWNYPYPGFTTEPLFDFGYETEQSGLGLTPNVAVLAEF